MTSLEQHQARRPLEPCDTDWNRIKPIFISMYCDQNKTLREVMEVLRRDFGFKARSALLFPFSYLTLLADSYIHSVKMFKTRIAKWGLEKKNNDRDMRTVIRLSRQRKAFAKKDSTFVIRGRHIELATAVQFFKRKGIDIDSDEFNDLLDNRNAHFAPTDVRCVTPDSEKSGEQPTGRHINIMETANEYESSSFSINPSVPAELNQLRSVLHLCRLSMEALWHDLMYQRSIFADGACFVEGPLARYFLCLSLERSWLKETYGKVPAGSHKLLEKRMKSFQWYLARKTEGVASMFPNPEGKPHPDLLQLRGLFQSLPSAIHTASIALVVEMLLVLHLVDGRGYSQLLGYTLQYFCQLAISILGPRHPLAQLAASFRRLECGVEFVAGRAIESLEDFQPDV